MTCNCNNQNNTNNSVKIKENYLGDTLLVTIFNAGSTEITINATSIITAIIKSLDTSLVQNIPIADLTNGNNFAAGIVKLESNFSFLAGTYQLLVKVQNGTQTTTIDTKQIIVYKAV